ncbi:MAG: hypothetical protein OEU26_33060, partial [Candidatus Tectomicrobia bacterium]|nr:hypothetical protein [Candidatus Tectomicrobia bacterium]
HLLQQPGMTSIKIEVADLLSGTQRSSAVAAAVQQADSSLNRNEDVVIFTSRELVTGDDADQSLSIGQRVSDGLVAIMQALTTRPRYILAKGGITSSDVATHGLGVRRAQVKGQILPGVPVWELGPETRHAGLSYIVFPGNVGGPEALGDVVMALHS